MEDSYQILESWPNTSLGIILTIKFFSKKRPEHGTIIRFNDCDYSIKGYMATANPTEAAIKLYERMAEGIYDCVVTSIE